MRRFAPSHSSNLPGHKFFRTVMNNFSLFIIVHGSAFFNPASFFFFNLCPSHLIYIHFFYIFSFFLTHAFFKKKTGVFRSVYMHHYFFSCINILFSQHPLFIYIFFLFFPTYKFFWFLFYNRHVRINLHTP